MRDRTTHVFVHMQQVETFKETGWEGQCTCILMTGNNTHPQNKYH